MTFHLHKEFTIENCKRIVAYGHYTASNILINIGCPGNIYAYLLLLISILWHRQAIFKSKGDKLCSSAESRILTRDPRHQIASRLNARWQTDWAIEDQAKNLNSTARPYDQRAFSPLDPTVSWLSHLAPNRQQTEYTYIYIWCFNYDALALGCTY